MHSRILGLALAVGLMASISEAATVNVGETVTNVRFFGTADQADIGTVTTPRLGLGADEVSVPGPFEYQITFAWPRAVPLRGVFWVYLQECCSVPYFTSDFEATLYDASGATLAEASLVSLRPNFNETYSLIFADTVPFASYKLVITGVRDDGPSQFFASIVPVPPAVLLFVTALGGLFLAHRHSRRKA